MFFLEKGIYADLPPGETFVHSGGEGVLTTWIILYLGLRRSCILLGWRHGFFKLLVFAVLSKVSKFLLLDRKFSAELFNFRFCLSKNRLLSKKKKNADATDKEASET